MALKTLLVCLTTQAHSDATLAAAVQLASKTGAHLVGIHTLAALVVYPGVAMHIPAGIYADFTAAEQKVGDALEQKFEAAVAGAPFTAEWRCLKAQSTSAEVRITESARAADLVMMPQGDPAYDRADQYDIQAQVIRGAGVPVLVIPPNYDGGALGDHIVIGHSPTREASRAVHDVHATFPDADITLLSVNEVTRDELKDWPTVAMAEFLTRHGHKTEVTHRDLAGRRIADVLEAEATQAGASIIAVGAFGHSAVYDFVIGATSNSLLRESGMPVLYSK